MVNSIIHEYLLPLPSPAPLVYGLVMPLHLTPLRIPKFFFFIRLLSYPLIVLFTNLAKKTAKNH